MDRPEAFSAAGVATSQTTPITRVAWVTRATPVVPQPKPKSLRSFKAITGTSPDSKSSSPSSYKGRNHVWIPALGVNRAVSFFPCSSSAYPGNRVYRWGCAGRNNVYLFGHAHSVFKSLHDAYVRGRLSKGMKVIYADNSGKVSTYAVTWWKVTTPDKGAWAYAGQSRPSLTLQTCVGSRSQYRLIVRLLKVS
jgi:sortase (surface protein transpeptidase)